jgi:hypothetical protein
MGFTTGRNIKITDNQRKKKLMEKSISKTAATPQTAVFPQTLHGLRANPKEATPNSKSQKRDNIFPKSRDTREDRGLRQMKTTHNSQTFFRDCGNSSR